MIVGLLTYAFLKTFKIKLYWLVILAVSKECYDLLVKGNFDFIDIAFTISPLIMETFTYIIAGILALMFIIALIIY